ncbi:hypothetical protein RA210_U240007 [Rubrivivax sp. A210]|nr:hypothetical protein RA210_U240007 [Rubrivivax sp. A210]
MVEDDARIDKLDELDGSAGRQPECKEPVVDLKISVDAALKRAPLGDVRQAESRIGRTRPLIDYGVTS